MRGRGVVGRLDQVSKKQKQKQKEQKRHDANGNEISSNDFSSLLQFKTNLNVEYIMIKNTHN